MKHKKMYELYREGKTSKLLPSRVVDVVGNNSDCVSKLRVGETYGSYPFMIKRIA